MTKHARMCFVPAPAAGDNKDGPRRCVNTAEGLTHSSGTSREGLAMSLPAHPAQPTKAHHVSAVAA